MGRLISRPQYIALAVYVVMLLLLVFASLTLYRLHRHHMSVLTQMHHNETALRSTIDQLNLTNRYRAELLMLRPDRALNVLSDVTCDNTDKDMRNSYIFEFLLTLQITDEKSITFTPDTSPPAFLDCSDQYELYYMVSGAIGIRFKSGLPVSPERLERGIDLLAPDALQSPVIQSAIELARGVEYYGTAELNVDRLAGLNREELRSRLADAEWRSAFFGYLLMSKKCSELTAYRRLLQSNSDWVPASLLHAAMDREYLCLSRYGYIDDLRVMERETADIDHDARESVESLPSASATALP